MPFFCLRSVTYHLSGREQNRREEKRRDEKRREENGKERKRR